MNKRSNFLAVFTIMLLLLLPMAYFTVSYQVDSRNDDDALLKRLTYIGGSMQRFIKEPASSEGIALEIDEAFQSSEHVYPVLLNPGREEQALADSYQVLKRCWERIKTVTAWSETSLKKQSELCWLHGNHALFDLHNVIKAKSDRLLNTLFMLGLFGTLLILYLFYLIYRYVRVDLEGHQSVDLQTGLYNAQAFIEECTVHALGAQRGHAPLSVVLMIFARDAVRGRSLKRLVTDMQNGCRREEKLFRLSPVSFALLTPHSHVADLAPLTERLQHILESDHLRNIQTLEYDPATDAEAFGLACLAEAEALQN
ncbi:hypothetical protein WCX18_03155 [Sulfurimonas sp. HSL1-2]|uniref:hypothetical protein n=1 Tax=Thiomicrolovo zhangzhouensis TaxID=3131933 RepID=UPI0031F83FD4